VTNGVEHILLTRFNLKCRAEPEFSAMYDEKWMRYRLNIFRKFTLPSVRGQTSNHFKWFIFFDEERTKPFEKEIDDIFTGNIFKIYADDLHNVPRIVNETLEPGIKTLISSRLDSDDVLHCHFISDVRELTERMTKTVGDFVVNFPRALMLDASSHKALLVSSDKVTQYGSLVETRERGKFLTSLSFDHTKLGEAYPVYDVDKVRTMSVVHERNWLTSLPAPTWRGVVKQILLRNGPKRIRLARKDLGEFSLCPITRASS
jgi:hypothetical protein